MRHGLKQRKLNKSSQHKRAMFANMAASLIKHEQIVTTLPKAKELKPFVEKVITLGKKGGLANYRRAIAIVRDETQVKKLFDILAERYADRQGGYTRVLKAGFRYGDMAPMAVVELVDRDPEARGKDSGPANTGFDFMDQAANESAEDAKPAKKADKAEKAEKTEKKAPAKPAAKAQKSPAKKAAKDADKK